jgi:hypothetical protein
MFSLSALCVLSMSTGVSASDDSIPSAYIAEGADSPIALYVAASRVEGPADISELGKGVDTSTLASMSGGTDYYNTTQNSTITGTVSSDSASHVYSGDNVITGSSFAGEAGIPIVVQNSGSNVLIQNATVISVGFKP